MTEWNQVKGELRDLAKALEVDLTVEADLIRNRIVILSGRQAFEFESLGAARQALELANNVAFQREVRKGAHLPRTDASPTGTTEKTYPTPNSVSAKAGGL